jgi:hypothetical protein
MLGLLASGLFGAAAHVDGYAKTIDSEKIVADFLVIFLANSHAMVFKRHNPE